nr:unnamed protein product [Callosobruchus analis]
MEENGKQEKQVAIEKGHIMPDGTPYITVIVDGGWSKRTYGHGYNAASGVGIIIGAETKKPLFLGVRNKVCSFCLFYQKKSYSKKPRDGDSSVYAKIVEKVPYGRSVEKIECANHMTRCVSDKLHKLGSNTSIPLEKRKLLTDKTNGISRIERLVKGVRTAIKRNVGNPNSLRCEVSNIPNHVFGRHANW